MTGVAYAAIKQTFVKNPAWVVTYKGDDPIGTSPADGCCLPFFVIQSLSKDLSGTPGAEVPRLRSG
jgi:hypothetical protein